MTVKRSDLAELVELKRALNADTGHSLLLWDKVGELFERADADLMRVIRFDGVIRGDGGLGYDIGPEQLERLLGELGVTVV